MFKPFISIGDTKVHCTLCLWYNQDRVATYLGLSPAHSWHGLCDEHHTLYGHKYTSVASVTNGMLPAWMVYIG